MSTLALESSSRAQETKNKQLRLWAEDGLKKVYKVRKGPSEDGPGEYLQSRLFLMETIDANVIGQRNVPPRGEVHPPLRALMRPSAGDRVNRARRGRQTTPWTKEEENMHYMVVSERCKESLARGGVRLCVSICLRAEEGPDLRHVVASCSTPTSPLFLLPCCTERENKAPKLAI